MIQRNHSTSTHQSYNQSNFVSSRNQRNNKIPAYDWDEMSQQTLLGAFYYGFVAVQIPGGVLAAKIGGKNVVTFVIISTSVIAALSPWTAGIHVGLLITLRILDGIVQGMVIPAVYTLLSKWSSVDDRSVMVSIFFAGMPIGGIVANYMSGLICSSYKIGGWPMSFYIYSMLGPILAIIWIIWVTESPEKDEITLKTNMPSKDKTQGSIPLYDILSSKPVWAIAIGKFTSVLGFNFLVIEMPTFLSTILGVHIRMIGLLTSIPGLTAAVTGICSAALADYIIRQKHLSVLKTRKLFVLIGFGVSGVSFIALAFTCYRVLGLEILYIIILAMFGFNNASVMPNPMDITVEYVGIVAGATHMVASFTGFIIPIITGFLIKEQNTIEQWVALFLIIGGMQILGMVFFIIFAEAKQQEWSEKNYREEKTNILITAKKQ
ncbi:sialin-like [Antedon mediterranea]|uniref:sialin-like n=1 Tax=Antedon mediterranea TaxID=105859 RepID=UPI003AF6AA82